MPDFGFVGPSYEAPSIYQDAQECINFRPEIDALKQPGQRGVEVRERSRLVEAQ